MASPSARRSRAVRINPDGIVPAPMPRKISRAENEKLWAVANTAQAVGREEEPATYRMLLLAVERWQRWRQEHLGAQT